MARRRKGNPVQGWINLDKPVGMSSTQAVSKVRGIFNAQKAGHAGTLDPLATGVLPIALGEATKTVPYVQEDIKGYAFDLKWGQATNTDDAEGEVIEETPLFPSQQQLENILPDFTGLITQIPPKFSAIKINGERAYKLARDGEDVEMPSRDVEIEKLEVKSHEKNVTSFETICGKGTYIRSLGRDIAKSCGGVGHISELRRTQVGQFYAEDAISLDKLESLRHKDDLDQALIPVQEVLDDIPALYVTMDEAVRLKNGNRVSFVSRLDIERLKDLGFDFPNRSKDALLLLCFEDTPLGIAHLKGTEIQPIKIFNY